MPVAGGELGTLKRFGTICRMLGLEELYVMYRVESWYSHPRWSSAATYISEVGGTTVAVQEPKEDHGPSVIAPVVCSLIWSAKAFDYALDGNPLKDALAAIAAGAGIRPLPPLARPRLGRLFGLAGTPGVLTSQA